VKLSQIRQEKQRYALKFNAAMEEIGTQQQVCLGGPAYFNREALEGMVLPGLQLSKYCLNQNNKYTVQHFRCQGFSYCECECHDYLNTADDIAWRGKY
jgi:hypothetical protein